MLLSDWLFLCQLSSDFWDSFGLRRGAGSQDVDGAVTCLCLPVQEPGHCADFHPSGAVVAIGTHSGR